MNVRMSTWLDNNNKVISVALYSTNSVFIMSLLGILTLTITLTLCRGEWQAPEDRPVMDLLNKIGGDPVFKQLLLDRLPAAGLMKKRRSVAAPNDVEVSCEACFVTINTNTSL